jgi:hypothetical protein
VPLSTERQLQGVQSSEFEKAQEEQCFHAQAHCQEEQKVRENPLEDSSSRSSGGIASLEREQKPRMQAS